MTWETDLFAFLDDLEAQAESAFAEEREFEVLDRARGEYAAVTLAERLMASVGKQVGLHLVAVGRVEGTVVRVADGWCLLAAAAGQEWIVRHEAISAARGLSTRAVPPSAWPVTAKLGFGSALRRIAESGSRCQVRLADGSQYDVLPTRVGADFLEAFAGAQGESDVYRFDAIVAVHTPQD